MSTFATRRKWLVFGAFAVALLVGSVGGCVRGADPVIERADEPTCSSETAEHRVDAFDFGDPAPVETSAAHVIVDVLRSGETPVAAEAEDADLVSVDEELGAQPAGSYVVRLPDGDDVELRPGLTEAVLAIDKTSAGAYRVTAIVTCFRDTA